MPKTREQTPRQQGRNADTEHNFLDLGNGPFADRIHMGGMRLSTRINIYLIFSFAALVVFAGMYIYVDQRVDRTLTVWRNSQNVAELVGRIETGVAKINSQEKQFLLSKDVTAAEAFDQDINDVSKALDKLYRLPESMPVRQTIATLRDGLVQYDEQFVDVVRAERVLGIADESGISARLQETTQTLQIRFRQAGHANLADQISRINSQGKETLSSGFRQGVDEIQNRYATLHAFLESAEIAPRPKADMTDLLKSHETDMLTLINQRFALDSETERFNDILAYVAPSLERLGSFSRDQTVSATRALEKIQAFARYTIAGGSAAILLWLIFVGLLLMRSMSNGIRALAISAQRIAAGERNVIVPGRGNIDAVGQAARALDRWADDLNLLDQLRQELDQTQRKLKSVIAESDVRAATAVATAKAAFIADIAAEPEPPEAYMPAPELPPEPIPEREPAPEREPEPEEVAGYEPRYIPSPLAPNVGMGPISSVSQQLAHFSEYVTAAAADVERTEQLIMSLQEATGQLENLGGLVTSVRDQTNLLAFHTTSRDGRPMDTENLIPFNEEGRRHAEGPFVDHGLAQRFDAIRDITERAERTVQAIRISMQNVTAMADEIGATASTQALEATNKLLSQSEYLQSMLDDIVHKIAPRGQKKLSDPGQQSPYSQSFQPGKKS
ncbi:MAG: hypothetical protein HQ483_11845 [Rhodospirillales bacterium]|nr:hypothetical protein [Rhodospirillales bacterium]